jgi:hypothetical protein
MDANTTSGDIARVAQEQLNKASISPADFVYLVNAFENEHRPIIESIIGPVVGSTAMSGGASGGSKVSVSHDLEIKKTRLLSRTRDLQRLIHSQGETERNRLDVELTILRDMSRQMSTENLGDEDIKFIEARINHEVQPHIDAVVQTPGGSRKTGVGGGMAGEDFLDRVEDDLEREYRMRKLNRMNREEMIRDREMAQSFGGQQNQNGVPPGMVPVHRQRIVNGVPEIDEKGNPVMETTYSLPDQKNDILMAVLPPLINNMGKDNGANAVMVQAMKDNTALLLATLAQSNKNDDGPSNREMMLEVQKENQAMIIEILKTQNQKDPELELKLETIRQEAAAANQRVYDTQLGFMSQKVSELQGALQQDPIDNLLHNREKFKALGMWNEGVTSVEEKTITEVTGLGREALGNFSESLNTFTTILSPLVQTYAENMRPQQPPPQPPRLDDTTKLQQYKTLLGNVDSAIEATAPQQDPAPLPIPPVS